MASNAEEFVIKMTSNVAAQAAADAGALSELQARAAALEAKLAEPMKSSTYRDLQAQIAAIDPSAASGALGNLASAEAESGAAAEAATDAHQEEMKALLSVGESADKAAAATDSATAANDNAGSSAGGAALPLGAMAKATKMLGGEMGGTASRALRLAKAFMTMGPYVALAVVAFALFAAALTAAVGVIIKGIGAADALRDNLLKIQGALAATQLGATKATVSASALAAMIQHVSDSSALGADKVQEYALQLAKTGMKGAELERALKAMADAGSAGGDEAAQAFLKAAEAAKASGSSVDAVTKKYEKLFGATAAAQAMSLSAQFAKLKSDLTDLFSGADIEPLLKGLRSILSLFDKNSAGAKSLKATITGFVNAAIGGILHVAISLVKLYIAVKQNQVAWTALNVVGYGILVILGLITAALLIAAAAGILTSIVIALPFIILGAVIYGAYLLIKAAWDGVKAAFQAAEDFISSIDLGSIGSSMIDGLVAGITAAGGAVLSAITGIVGGAIDAAKSLLHINSPSLVFQKIGASTGEGMSMGVDASADSVAASAGDMARGAVGAAVAVPKSGPAAARGKGGPEVNFNNCTFGAGTTKESIREWWRQIVEEDGFSAEPAMT